MKTIKTSNDPVIKDLYGDIGEIVQGFEMDTEVPGHLSLIYFALLQTTFVVTFGDDVYFSTDITDLRKLIYKQALERRGSHES